jgi:hypothetical protein
MERTTSTTVNRPGIIILISGRTAIVLKCIADPPIHMDRMFLPDVERHQGDDNYGKTIRFLQHTGPEYPQILHLFSYRINATVHLERFTQEIMREPSPLAPGIRELIAAYTSALNHCPF